MVWYKHPTWSRISSSHVGGAIYVIVVTGHVLTGNIRVFTITRECLYHLVGIDTPFRVYEIHGYYKKPNITIPGLDASPTVPALRFLNNTFTEYMHINPPPTVWMFYLNTSYVVFGTQRPDILLYHI